MKLEETKLQEVVEKIAYQQFRQEQIDDLYAKMSLLNEYVQEQLLLFVSDVHSQNCDSGCDCPISNTDKVNFFDKCTPKMYGC